MVLLDMIFTAAALQDSSPRMAYEMSTAVMRVWRVGRFFELEAHMPGVNMRDERRVNTELRSIFPLVFEVLRPYFDQATQWEGQSHEHFAYRSLKEQFPGLTAQDCFIAVATARRIFVSGVPAQIV